MLSKIYWLNLTIPQRTLLIMNFNIPKTGFTHVQDGQIISDGYTDQDLQTLTLQRLQEYLKTNENDFGSLLKATIEKLENEEKEKVLNAIKLREEEAVRELERLAQLSQVVKPVVPEPETKQRGRPKKYIAF